MTTIWAQGIDLWDEENKLDDALNCPNLLPEDNFQATQHTKG